MRERESYRGGKREERDRKTFTCKNSKGAFCEKKFAQFFNFFFSISYLLCKIDYF